jgi:hypothetical protein
MATVGNESKGGRGFESSALTNKNERFLSFGLSPNDLCGQCVGKTIAADYMPLRMPRRRS